MKSVSVIKGAQE